MSLRPNRGEIWLADLSPTRGHEHAEAHPVLIISTNIFNHGPADLVCVLPLTHTDDVLPFTSPLIHPKAVSLHGAILYATRYAPLPKIALDHGPGERLSSDVTQSGGQSAHLDGTMKKCRCRDNAAERSIRPGVLGRKGSVGTQSAAGSRFVERRLTVVSTLKQQQRNVFAYLTAVCEQRSGGKWLRLCSQQAISRYKLRRNLCFHT